MKVSKIDGLRLLKQFRMPTVELIDPNLIDENSNILKQGLSVRISPKEDRAYNVNLPSIHNCTDIDELREFIRRYQAQNNIIVHKTVKPEIIGSISRYGNYVGEEVLAIDIFDDFVRRDRGILKNRMDLPIVGGRFNISKLQMANSNEGDFQIFSKIIRQMLHMPFEKFDAEFVIQDKELLFTDLTVPSNPVRDYERS